MIASILPSLIRTWVPIAVAWAVAQLVALGIPVTDEQTAMLTMLIGALAGVLWHLSVRLLESRWPWTSVFLGSLQQPAGYVKPALPPAGGPRNPSD